MFDKKKDTEKAAGPVANEPAGTAEETATAQEQPKAELPLEDLIRLCQEKVCPGCTVKAEADDIRLRALAELENVKKRLLREKEEQFKYATENVLGDLLPVLDNLELAIQYGNADPACRNLLMGVEMTRKIFLDVLRTHGLTPLGEAGDEFDPEFHEAISQEVREDVEPGHIITVQQRGYRLKERTLRPAKVIVSARLE